MSGTILITVEEARDARPIGADAQLYLPQIDRAMRLVHEALARVQKAKTDAHGDTPEPFHSSCDAPARLWSEDRTHQNMGILGRRGAGKTSVLLTLLRLLCDRGLREDYAPKISAWHAAVGKGGDNPGSLPQMWDRVAERVSITRVIEPSLMEKGDHIIAAVLGALLEQARDVIRRWEGRRGQPTKETEELRRAHHEVNVHLPVLIMKERLTDSFTRLGPEGLSDEVTTFRSGSSLEVALTRFIDAYLELVGRDLLIIPLDDVDLAFEKGEEVLESLRRYLTSARALVIVTGDPILFSSVIRMSIHDKARADRACGSDHRHALDDTLVEDIEEQYQKKILPPYLRVPLPDISELDLDSIKLRKVRNGTEDSVTFKEHFSRVIGACLSLDGNDGEQQDLTTERRYRSYRFLVPPDARHFIELCSIDTKQSGRAGTGARNHDVLFELASVWRSALAPFDLGPRRLVALARRDRVGLVVLNLLIEHARLKEVALRLDPRTSDPQLNVALAFLRFAIDGNLGTGPTPSPLTLGLDFFVPAHYLGDIKSGEAREEVRRELELQLMDSHRRFYRRFVPWLARRKRIQAGVVQLCDYPGHVEKLLDIHCASAEAGWRAILGDPERCDFPAVRKQATKRSRDYLSGQMSSPRRRPSDKAEADARGRLGDQGWPEISGYRWSARLLRDTFASARADGLFANDPNRLDGRPYGSEMVTSPHLFHQLAGALPRVVLQSWTIHDGRHTYLSPWQGLSLVQRVVSRIVGLFSSKNDGPDHGEVKPSAILDAVQQCLGEQLGGTGGPSPTMLEPEKAGLPAIAAEGIAAANLPEEWGELSREVRVANAPLSLFPELRGPHVTLFWPDPPDPAAADEPKPAPPETWTPHWSWFTPQTDSDHANRYPDLRPLGTRNELQAFRLQAWDETLRRLALAITEWALYWRDDLRSGPGEDGKGLGHPLGQRGRRSGRGRRRRPRWAPLVSGSLRPTVATTTTTTTTTAGGAGRDDARGHGRNRRPGFEEIRNVFTTFFEELGDEEAFTGTWSGTGDILQRWVLTFLNAVLVETLVPPSKGPRVRPQLLHGTPQGVPGRTAAVSEGCDHPLYQNLAALRNLAEQAKNNGDETWKLSRSFLLLASFPCLGMFLPGGGPMPVIPSYYGRSDDLTVLTELATDGHDPELTIIMQLGSLLLLPLPAMRDLSSVPMGLAGRSSRPLDLAGLSWCGIELSDVRRHFWWVTASSDHKLAAMSEEDEQWARSPKTNPRRPPRMSWPAACSKAPFRREVFYPPLNHVEPRRRALIEMLNSVQADVTPAPDAEKYLVDLSLAVYRALKEDATVKPQRD